MASCCGSSADPRAILGSDAARAVGRFRKEGPLGYRAKSGGPLRATRAEAEADERANRELEPRVALCNGWNDAHDCGLPLDHPGDHQCVGCADVWNRGPWDHDADEWEHERPELEARCITIAEAQPVTDGDVVALVDAWVTAQSPRSRVAAIATAGKPVSAADWLARREAL